MVTKKADDKYVELKNSISKLEYELQMSNERIAYLQGELDQVSSLKTHIKKYAKKQARRIDNGIESKLAGDDTFSPVVPSTDIKDLVKRANTADMLNFEKIQNMQHSSFKLRVYSKTKHTIIGYLRAVKK